MNRVACDVAVVGGGPGGLAAAIGARETGARRVVVIERDGHLGGILQQCIHNGFGLSILEKDLTGPEYAHHYVSEALERGVRCFTNAMAIGLSPDRRITAVSPEAGLITIEARAVVLAMGCRERTRGAVWLPGTRPAGIMTAGAAQRFINIDGYLPGRRIVVLGSGDIGMIMARRLHLEGCIVEAVVEYRGTVGGLTRNLVQCIRDFDIPLYLRHTVTAIRGTRRVTGVDISPVDEGGAPDASRSQTLACDTLLLSVGLIPENELSKQAGVQLDEGTGGPIVNESFHTSVPGVFAAGNVLHVYDLVDDVTRCALAAGTSAARFAADYEATGPSTDAAARIVPGAGVRSVVPQRLSAHLPDTVEFHLRASTEGRRRTLELTGRQRGTVYRRRCPVVRASEMVRATVRGIGASGDDELTFRIGENCGEP